MIAVARWRVAVTSRSLTFAPPLLAELLFLGVMFTTGPQTEASAVAVSCVALFVLGVWFGWVNAGALAADGRNVTAVGAGARRAFAGEVLAGVTIVVLAAVVAALAPLPVVRPVPGPGPVLLGLAAVVTSGLVGLAGGAVITAARLRPALRFTATVGLVTLAFVRPARDDAVAVATVLGWVVPPVLGLARVVADRLTDAPGAVAAATAGCLAWAAVAAVLAGVVAARREDRP